MSFASHVNLGGLREALRIRTGLPEEGPTGTTRANRVLNYALREFFGDLPTMFERDEHRIRLAPKYTDGTLDVCPLDFRVFRIVVDPAAVVTDLAELPDDGSMVGRWIDITAADGVVHRKRICDVSEINTGTWWGDGNVIRTVITVDSPWRNLGDSASPDEGLTYRAFTLEYPLPPDWREVTDVYRLEGSGSPTLLTAVFPEELERSRIFDDWLSEGSPTMWTRGDFFQLRSPHDTPTVTANSAGGGTYGAQTDNQKRGSWGWDTDTPPLLHGTGGATPYYEPAGTFEYCYCLGWGIQADVPESIRDVQIEPELIEQTSQPFYISAPSTPTGTITTTWAVGARNVLVSVEQDWVQHYTADSSQPSYHRSGLKKYWFRRRTTVQTPAEIAAVNPAIPLPVIPWVETDGEFYLWQITDAFDMTLQDGGDAGQPIINFPLKEFAGHQSIRFNRIPSDETTTVVIRGRRLPDRLKHDTDMVRCPTDCTEAIVYMAASILAGERDAKMDRAEQYRQRYELAVRKLRRKYGSMGGRPTPAGSIEGGRTWYGPDAPIEEIT